MIYLVIYVLHALLVAIGNQPIDRVVMIMNATAFIIICTSSTDLIAFYLLYELTSLLTLPVLLTSSRSVRKGYALTSLLYVNLIGLAAFLVAISTDLLTAASQHTDSTRAHVYVLLLLTIIAAKTPCYPLMFWLPEAHVECS